MATRLLDRATGAIIAALALSLIAVLAGVIDAGPLDPPGPPGSPASPNSVKLPGTPISSVPITINASGHYYVTDNLSYTGSGNAIEIAGFVKYVTLDLGGFTLSGVDAGTGIAALGPSPPSQFPLQIRNGYVRDFTTGINMELAAHSRIDDVHVYSTTGDGIRMGNHDVLSNCTVALSGGQGVVMAGSLATLSDCYIVDNFRSGVNVIGFGNVVEESQIIRNNTSSSTPHANIRFDTIAAARNVIRNNDLSHFSTGFSLYSDSGGGNVIIGNTYCGFDNGNQEIFVNNIDVW